MVKSLGADKVIDYKKEDFTKNGEKYDVIFDTVGKASFSDCIKSMNKNAYLMLANADLSTMFKGLWTSIFSSKKILTGIIKESSKDMKYLKELIEIGQLKAVIDKSYPLEQIAEAHARVDTGHKKGNVIITF